MRWRYLAYGFGAAFGALLIGQCSPIPGTCLALERAYVAGEALGFRIGMTRAEAADAMLRQYPHAYSSARKDFLDNVTIYSRGDLFFPGGEAMLLSIDDDYQQWRVGQKRRCLLGRNVVLKFQRDRLIKIIDEPTGIDL